MFKLNETVVYVRDVCKITKVDEKKEYYTLKPIEDESLIIRIPFDNDKIRPLISKKEVEEIINQIPEIEVLDLKNHKMLENKYKKLLNSDDHLNLVQIIKTTRLRNKERIESNKKTSERDNNYLNLAEKLLYNEFAAVLDMTFEETQKYIAEKVEEIKENQ